MFDEYHYVPVLKWKRGEQVGLQDLNQRLKEEITPLIEIQPIPWDYKNNCEKYTIDEYLSKLPKTILRSWEAQKPYFLDLKSLKQETTNEGQPVIKWLYDNLCPMTIMIPVVSLSSTSTYLKAIKELMGTKNYGICLRIFIDEIDEPELFKISATKIIDDLNIGLNNVDLIIDLKYLSESMPLVTIKSILNAFIFSQEEWRTISLISSSFPYDMSLIARDSIEALHRLEWQLWEKVLVQYKSGHIVRMPSFGDYGISNPETVEIDPSKMNMSGHLRYTIAEEYLIVKGAAVRDVKGKGGRIVRKGRGYDQMRYLCQILITHSNFYGEEFSMGDKYIVDCANGIVSTGTAETWRRVGTNHHLAVVASQIANHRET